jgi:glycosyltransferase involved in cell wall biosynthesis
MNPTVSFVVPCYKLAHLLGECILSILSQTYADFEILILDDCSPDNTADVAASFQDPRVRYIRNETNLKHLRNYNKGISLARGKYIWLISADDCLRRPYVLERYVRLLDQNPNVGYVFCSAVGLFNGRETGVLDYSVHGNRDAIIPGRRFLAKLVHANTIVAASGMVRKECYDKVGLFPLDMPWGGDWYLWCAFALHFDVAYMAEPMVCYRRHDSSMTNVLMQGNIDACYSDDIKIPWIIKKMVDESGSPSLSRECLRAIGNEYAHSMTGKQYKAANSYSLMTPEQFESSLGQHTPSLKERAWVRALVYSGMADRYYSQCNFALARQFYYQALRENFWKPKIWVKWLLLSCGRVGIELRSRVARFASLAATRGIRGQSCSPGR